MGFNSGFKGLTKILLDRQYFVSFTDIGFKENPSAVLWLLDA